MSPQKKKSYLGNVVVNHYSQLGRFKFNTIEQANERNEKQLIGLTN